jgi:hypothetical protein
VMVAAAWLSSHSLIGIIRTVVATEGDTHA